MRIFIAKRPGTLRVAPGASVHGGSWYQWGFCCRDGESNLPWEGPLTTLVTSLAGPVWAYAISVIAIVALRSHACVPWRGDGRDDAASPSRLALAVCLVVFAAQVMTSFIGQSAEIAILQPVHAIAQGGNRQ